MTSQKLKGFRPFGQLKVIAVIEQDGKDRYVEVVVKIDLARHKRLVVDLKAGYRQVIKSGVVIPKPPLSDILDQKKS